MPEVLEITSTPRAREEALTTAMAASLFHRGLSATRRRRKAAATTTGMEKYSGVNPRAAAMARAPKDTWLRPSPIMEYRFRTKGTPSRAAQRLTSTPATRAR